MRKLNFLHKHLKLQFGKQCGKVFQLCQKKRLHQNKFSFMKKFDSLKNE